jgi:hypothetical protein
MHHPCQLFQSHELTPNFVAQQSTARIFISTTVTSIVNFGRCRITGVYFGYMNHCTIGSLMECSSGIRFVGDGQVPAHLVLGRSAQEDPRR